MDKEQRLTLLGVIEEKALKLLDGTTRTTQHSVILHLWYQPSHTHDKSRTAWIIYKIQEDYFVLEIRWDEGADIKRVALSDNLENISTEPTMMERTTKLDAERVIDLLERGSQIHIPIIGVEFPTGRDGDLCGIRLPNRFEGKIYIEWWFSGPKEWRPLTKWYHELTDFLWQSLKETSK